MADEKQKCGKCGAVSTVYTMSKLYECDKCNAVVCANCIPDDCVKGKFIFKKFLCPECNNKLRECEIPL